MSLALLVFPLMGVLGFLAYIITPHQKSAECNKWFLIYVASLVSLWIFFNKPFNEDLKLLNAALIFGGFYGLLISGPGLLVTISNKQDPLQKHLTKRNDKSFELYNVETEINNLKTIIRCSKCQQRCRVPTKKQLEIKCPKCRHTWIQYT